MNVERLFTTGLSETETHSLSKMLGSKRKGDDYNTKIELLRKIASLRTFIEWLETDKAEVIQRLYRCIDSLRDANHSKFFLHYCLLVKRSVVAFGDGFEWATWLKDASGKSCAMNKVWIFKNQLHSHHVPFFVLRSVKSPTSVQHVQKYFDWFFSIFLCRLGFNRSQEKKSLFQVNYWDAYRKMLITIRNIFLNLSWGLKTSRTCEKNANT